MDDIILTRELRSQGYGASEIRSLLLDGEVSRIRRGAYSMTPRDNSEIRQAHHRLIEATIAQCDSEVVVSHGSAAVLHGLPIWRSELRRSS